MRWRKRSAWQMLMGHAYSATVDGSVTIGLGYAAEDPYAVHVLVSADATDASCWVFARDLLLAGLTGQAGEGDVVIGTEPGASVVSIILRNGRDMLAIDLPRAPLCQFAADMLSIVPRGREGGYVDVDAGLRSLLA
ncbi:SsgA family sporulation/cell division regulator [Micromonospora sp. CPCC 206061]|uniref:SsgA family sporulation/cell division regulator n=1 Tax=Micromonospora sp. CPCC 206061 TaxID=3122410 RepID=UPI002FF1DC41